MISEGKLLKISEVAERTGLSTHTLRFYEKQNLISSTHRSESGYRLYTESDLRRVEFIRAARSTGFSLEEIAALLSIRLDPDGHTCEEVTEITRHKLAEVREKIKELTLVRRSLQSLLKSCCGGPERATHCSIMDTLESGPETADESRATAANQPAARAV